MIALLSGQVISVEDDEVVINVHGVGYQVYCHLRTLAALHDLGEQTEVTLHIHTAVGTDAIRFFGFLSREELRLFRQLIGVERIGPKAALGILGRAELPTLVRAIRGGDAAFVATVPGIGRKTAERVVLELRDKLGGVALPGDTPVCWARDLRGWCRSRRPGGAWIPGDRSPGRGQRRPRRGRC